MKRILFVLFLLVSVPAFANHFDSFMGQWVGSGHGTWGHMTGYKYIFSENGFVGAEFTASNGEEGYASTLACYSETSCTYSDSWGNEKNYTVASGSNGSVTFSWYDDNEFENIRWFFSKNGSFMEHYTGFVNGHGQAY